MDKLKNIQIFEVAFKEVPYGFDDNALFTPIQAGADLYDNDICSLKDNVGDNISSANWFFCEETATYWIWKHLSDDYKYIGQCQYRRRLPLAEDFDYSNLFKTHDIIVPLPYTYRATIEDMYKRCHISDDIEAIEKIIKEKYPEYSEAYDKIIKNGHMLLYSASYVMRSSDFKEWCSFFFGVMEEYKKVRNYDDRESVREYVKGHIEDERDWEYQTRIGGYLHERLFTMWVLSRFPMNRMYFVNYKLMENNLA